MTISVRPLSDVMAAEVTGIDLARGLDEAAFARLLEAFHAHKVIVFRDQFLAPADQVAFSARFGPLEIHDNRRFALPGFEEILILSNDRKDGRAVGVPDAGDSWHSDLSFKERPSLCTILQAVRLPEAGGDTEFADMCAAYEALPEATRRRIAGLKAMHTINKLRNPRIAISPLREDASAFYAAQDARQGDTAHPVVRTHPATGRKALYVQPRFTIGIEGMDDAEAQPLLDALFAHQLRPEFRYRHRWRPGDLLMWDNRCVIHKAAGGYTWPDVRTMHRTTVLGDRPH